jgi:type I restriction enzyme, R subunit
MNQNPEQIARDEIDKQLTACGWIVQDKKHINLRAGLGVAVCEYHTNVGPADYVLFVEDWHLGLVVTMRQKVKDTMPPYK